MRFLKHIPRWWRWTITLMVILSLTTGVVVIAKRTTNTGYACLVETGNAYVTHTFDTTTGQIFTSGLLDPASKAVYWNVTWPSPDKSKVAFYWQSDTRQQFITMVDLRTLQKQTVTLPDGDDATLRGWSADSKFLTVDEKVASGTNTLTIFDTSTMQSVLSQYWIPQVAQMENSRSQVQWSAQGHQLAYMNADTTYLRHLTIVSLTGADAQTISFANTTQLPPQDFIFPLWSPDNHYIALSDYQRIWLYDTRKMALQLVTDHADLAVDYGEIDRIRWSADSKELLYIETSDKDDSKLLAFYPEDGHYQTLATDHVYLLAVSPDQKFELILHRVSDELASYGLLNISTGHETTIKSNAPFIEPLDVYWSMDSRMVSLTFRDGLFWTQVDGTGQHEVRGLDDFIPLVRDDEHIIYETLQNNVYSVGLINLNTGENHRFKGKYPTSFDVDLSPRKDMLALTSNKGVGNHDVKVNLLSIGDKQSGSFETASGDNGWVVWSPDSSVLALLTFISNGPTTLHVLNPDGTEIRHLDNAPDQFYPDKWTDCS